MFSFQHLPPRRIVDVVWNGLLICWVSVVVGLAARPAQAAAELGKPAPAFELLGTDGAPLKLDSLRGRVVYLDFWASWCGPCRQSFPWMAAVQQRHEAAGLTVVAINVDARQADALSFLKTTPAGFRVVFDASGKTPREYGIKAMPTSVLIGRDGRVRLVHAGFKPSQTPQLEEAIEAALKEPAK